MQLGFTGDELPSFMVVENLAGILLCSRLIFQFRACFAEKATVVTTSAWHNYVYSAVGFYIPDVFQRGIELEYLAPLSDTPSVKIGK